MPFRIKDIGEKAKKLAETSGHFTGGDCDCLGSDMEKVYDTNVSGKKLSVLYGEGYASGGVHNTSVRIEFDGKEVFRQENGKMSHYVPGLWTRVFA